MSTSYRRINTRIKFSIFAAFQFILQEIESSKLYL